MLQKWKIKIHIKDFLLIFLLEICNDLIYERLQVISLLMDLLVGDVQKDLICN